jgi:hypothetical protein
MRSAGVAAKGKARTMKSGKQARVLFVNDTARNGGPGRSLHSIL